MPFLYSYNSKYYDLSSEPVKFNLEAGEYSERFKITYTNKEEIYINWDIVKDISNFNIFQNNPESRLEIRIPEKPIPRDIILFDSLGKPIDNFPVYGNSTIDLDNIDKEKSPEFVTKGDKNSIIIYQMN